MHQFSTRGFAVNDKFNSKIDYYKILEVDSKASQDDIKKKFYSMAKKYHPDSQETKTTKVNEEKFKQISEAWEVLSNEDTKNDYDLARQDDNNPWMRGASGTNSSS
jgi:DnaJ-class molecular chaperone